MINTNEIKSILCSFFTTIIILNGRLALSRIQNSQDLQEEIDDVQVEVNDTDNVLLRAQVLHDHVCVEDNETGEDKSADHCQNRVSCLILKEDL